MTVNGGSGGNGISNADGGAGGSGRIYMPLPSPGDLVVTDVAGPTDAAPGEMISVLNTVKNTLPVNISVSFRVGLYLSLDQDITTGDIYLGDRLLSGITGDFPDTALTDVTIPAGISTGTYYLGAIADYEDPDAVDELNENNNTGIQSAPLAIQ